MTAWRNGFLRDYDSHRAALAEKDSWVYYGSLARLKIENNIYNFIAAKGGSALRLQHMRRNFKPKNEVCVFVTRSQATADRKRRVYSSMPCLGSSRTATRLYGTEVAAFDDLL